ncbi:multicopper oxidase family protein [Virgibacillus oceani]|uniref:Copper oxidase n=1 Tax=Virgibacillus oceani TaxID=1479511 RepID=A0A917GY17_9BACI|nr:multicopper oxidase family protein [Virgibacillus oceani]GGG61157.1 copper oxidase [Virgibacillus oceani]
MKKIYLFIIIIMVSILAACSQQSSGSNDQEKQSEEVESQTTNQASAKDTDEKKVNEINLTAKEVKWTLSPDKTITAWTYNGTVPGEQIRVKEGELVRVNLTNELDKPVTIHWHGVPVPNTEDGIPGVTQDAIVPGKTYTYEFVANTPGTYWYHSHQNGVEQIDKGLYGTFIVEPKKGVNVDRDYTLVLDEWESGNEGHGMDMEGMDMGDMDNMANHSESEGSSMMGHDMSSYDIFTINGKTYKENKPLIVKKGDKVKLRFVNAGYMVHKIHIPVDYKVTHVDGQKVNNPEIQKGSVLEVAPGERYDIKFIADGSGDFTIDCHGEMDAAKDMKIDVVYKEGNGKKIEHSQPSTKVDLTTLGEDAEAQFTLEDEFDVEYTMDLGTKMDMSNEDMGMAWTINGETYPNVPPLKIDKGDKVKVTLTNNSMDESTHPMHLHGHFFQVLSKNGQPLEGSPIIKDTLNVKPGETYEVAFIADNPGNWLFHCHDLHHASSGMVMLVKYNNFEEFYTDTGKVDNKPQ